MSGSQSTYSSYHLEGKVVEGERGKKVLVAVAKGRRTTGVEDGTAIGLGYGIPISREFSRHHLEDKVVVKEWRKIHPWKRSCVRSYLDFKLQVRILQLLKIASNYMLGLLQTSALLGEE
nr:hypothetical protein [Tanacetum cinerariifolium]